MKHNCHQTESPKNESWKTELRQSFRTKLSPEIAKLAKQSEAIARQMLPSIHELDFSGLREPFEAGKNNQGIYGMERIYEDRVVLTPYFECAAYCRYCFKKTRTLGGEAKRMTEADIDQAIRYISTDTRINTVLITGGDPFLDFDMLEELLNRIEVIPHIRNIRIGTRNILFTPESITDNRIERIARFQRFHLMNPKMSRCVSVGFSLNHPDELTPSVIEALSIFHRHSVSIKGQVVLLKGVNAETRIIQELSNLMIANQISPYYVFHCMPVIGANHFRTSVQKGIDILRDLARFSGTTAFQYVYVTPVGKHRLNIDSKLNYVFRENQRLIRNHTVYKAADFLQFSGQNSLPVDHEVDSQGYIISHYLDGDDMEDAWS